jgi:hypothetical protein
MKQEEKPREKCDLKKSPRVNVLLPITFRVQAIVALCCACGRAMALARC